MVSTCSIVHTRYSLLDTCSMVHIRTSMGPAWDSMVHARSSMFIKREGERGVKDALPPPPPSPSRDEALQGSDK
jgi:hypothetical protein